MTAPLPGVNDFSPSHVDNIAEGSSKGFLGNAHDRSLHWLLKVESSPDFCKANPAICRSYRLCSEGKFDSTQTRGET